MPSGFENFFESNHEPERARATERGAAGRQMPHICVIPFIRLQQNTSLTGVFCFQNRYGIENLALRALGRIWRCVPNWPAVWPVRHHSTYFDKIIELGLKIGFSDITISKHNRFFLNPILWRKNKAPGLNFHGF